MKVDSVCGECGSVFQKVVGVPGRPRVFCSKRCKRKAERQRAAAHVINLDEYTPWDGSGLERWTGDDAG